MDWRQSGAKPLLKPMLTKTPLGLSELTIYVNCFEETCKCICISMIPRPWNGAVSLNCSSWKSVTKLSCKQNAMSCRRMQSGYQNSWYRLNILPSSPKTVIIIYIVDVAQKRPEFWIRFDVKSRYSAAKSLEIVYLLGSRLNIKMLPYHYRDSHFKDKTVSRPSYLYNENLHTWKNGFMLQCGHVPWRRRICTICSVLLH